MIGLEIFFLTPRDDEPVFWSFQKIFRLSNPIVSVRQKRLGLLLSSFVGLSIKMLRTHINQ